MWRRVCRDLFDINRLCRGGIEFGIHPCGAFSYHLAIQRCGDPHMEMIDIEANTHPGAAFRILMETYKRLPDVYFTPIEKTPIFL
jgi:hypothetical protein